MGWDDVVDSTADGESSGDDSSTGSSGSTSSSSSSSSSSTTTETYSLSEDEKVTPGESEISDKSKEISEGAELNYGEGTGSLSSYKKRQIKEVEELHDDMYRIAQEYGNTVPEFTLVMHAAMMNFAQNRVGIAQTLMDEFGKSKTEALEITNEICSQAGERKTIAKIINYLTRKMMG